MAITDSAQHSPILGSVRRLSATILGILQTRLALAGIELEEEIQRLIAALLVAFGMLIFASLGMLVFTLMIVFASPPEDRVGAMAALSVIYLVIAGGFWFKLRARLASRPPIFEATLAELEKDRQSLKGGDATMPAEAAPPGTGSGS